MKQTKCIEFVFLIKLKRDLSLVDMYKGESLCIVDTAEKNVNKPTMFIWATITLFTYYYYF